MITEGLGQSAGRRLRLLLSRWTDTAIRAGLVGLLAGFIAQSTSAVSFILASLVTAGMTNARRALPVILWANAGACLLVLIAVLDLETFVLFVIGIAGIALASDRSARYKPLALTLFGAGLIFYGLILLRAGAAPLAHTGWFEGSLFEAAGSYPLLFALSALLRLATQSTSAVIILAITLADAGLFNVEQTIMIIYGANLGSGLFTWMLATRLRGRSKQLVMAQVLFNCVTCLLFVSLFYLEVHANFPLVRALTGASGASLEREMAYVYLLFNWTGAAVLSFFVVPMARLLERLWPPTQRESWSEMRFLHDQALHDPETALILVAREQSHLLGQLPLYLQELRKTTTGDGTPAYESIHAAFESVAREIAAFTAELFRQEITAATSEKALNVQKRQKLLEGLEEVVRELVLDLNAWVASTGSTHLRDAFIEGLDTLLLTAHDAAASGRIDDVELLSKITQDRGELLKTLRQNYIAAENSLTPGGRQLFLRVTGLFETTVWLLSRMAQLQRQSLALEDNKRY